MITQEDLKSVLRYDPETGLFTWIKKTGKRIKPGYVAGTVDPYRYARIRIYGVEYKLHRLAWLYMTGEFPKNEIDHIDGNIINNKLENLRECTTKENAQNRAKIKGKNSKFIGVSWCKKNKKFSAQIRYNGKKTFLGYFEKEEDAYKAYCKAKSKMHTFNPIVREDI